MLKYPYTNRWYINKQTIHTNIYNVIQSMAKQAHTRSRAYSYTVHNLCICPRRLFSIQSLSVSNKTITYNTVKSHCRCLTRKFSTTQYTLSVSNKTIPCYTLHCTHSLSLSNKTIPHYTLHTHCLCPTRKFPTTPYTLTVCV